MEFFAQARALGDHLTVCIPSDEVLFIHKHRRPFIPVEHKLHLVQSLRMVDEVVIGSDLEPGLNFKTEFEKRRPSILAVTEDDQYEGLKKALCTTTGSDYIRLPKDLGYAKTSTTDIFQRLRAPAEAPMRVDFAGGWLDVPRFSRPDGFVVNCAVSPMVSLYKWPYEKCSGMGGSGAYALLMAKDGVASELANDVGWQDPAIITETGLCVWRSGKLPVLDAKVHPGFLAGKMAILWTGKPHDTHDLSHCPRNYDLLAEASRVARAAAMNNDLTGLCRAISLNHQVQIEEGMAALPSLGERARKYCGSGHGGYALYVFDKRPTDSRLMAIEPYLKQFEK